ncbi:hypothetical protein CDAR_208111, partial [Caerostris darwini]
ISTLVLALVGYTLATGGGNYGSGSGSGGGNYGSVSGGGGGNYGSGSSVGYTGGGSRGNFGGNFGGQNEAPKPYKFDYNAADEQGNSHYRTEEGDASGTVRGTYGYTDNQGLYRVVEYVADAGGFRANVRTNEPGTDGKESPADVQLTVEQPPAGIQNTFGSGGSYTGGSQSSYGTGYGGGSRGGSVSTGGGATNYGTGSTFGTGFPGGSRGGSVSTGGGSRTGKSGY